MNHKFHKQLNEYYCGPACLQMTLDGFGIKKAQKAIAQIVKTTETSGTSRVQMRSLLKKLGLNTFIKTESSLNDLKTWLKKGAVIIVNYIEVEGEGHYAILKKIDGDKIILNDPWHGENYKISKRYFLSHWRGESKGSKKRWFLAVYK